MARPRRPPAAALGVGLLVADVLLPVPSSAVMVAHGALFGVLAGTLLSLAGGVGATLAAFAVGRAGGPVLERLVSPSERERASRLLDRWGPLAIAVSRPVPLLAETVAVLAGASPLGWGRAALAAVAGTLPIALLYALVGTAAASTGTVLPVLAAVLLAAAAAWLLGGRQRAGRARTAAEVAPPRAAPNAREEVSHGRS